MKRTTVRGVLATFVGGFSVGYLTNLVLVSTGMFAMNVPLTMPFTLALISGLTLVLAWPIRQRLRGKRKQPINALHAGRVSALAKTSSLVGGVMLGLNSGLVTFFVTRSVVPGFGILLPALLAVAASAALLAAGLIAERWCSLPPDDPNAEATEPGELIG